MISGGQAVVKALKEHGVERVFSVAGESYLPVLDALYDAPQIQLITNRQESGASFAAEAYGLLTGKPGVAFVTRGPGACNASIGVHAARQSSSPMIIFVGLVRREDRGKEAFQDFDLPQMFASHSKWAAVIDDPARIGEYIARAFHLALSGRPGPVVLGLPEDILSKMIEDKPAKVAAKGKESADMHAVRNALNILGAASKPLIIAGGSLWSDEACTELGAFAARAHIPVAASFRRQDLVDHNAGYYVGELGTGPNPVLVEAVKEADTILVLGARINEIMAQSYTLLRPEQTLIHVYSSSEEIGKAYAPDMAVQCALEPFVAALAASRLDGRRWSGWKSKLRAQYVEWTDIESGTKAGWDGADMTQVFAQLRDVLPKDAIVTTDAGNFSGWCQRYLRYGGSVDGVRGRLLAPLSGAMGYAVPSAVSAALECPDRRVVGICGDGGFMMTSMEMATAMQAGAKPIFIVCNNSIYGTIRMHQCRDFPGRPSGTSLVNPDFVAMAKSFGAFAVRVEHEDAFEEAWSAACAADTLAVIEIKMDPGQITTRSKSD